MALLFAKTNTQEPQYAVSTEFNAKQVRHGYFGRTGGVSTGPYDSLNAGLGKTAEGDHLDAIYENRRRIAGAMKLPVGRLLSLAQDHTTRCWSINEPQYMETRPVGDAMVTNKLGVGLGVLTADCAPVLFHADSSSIEAPYGVVGAAHAGHKGARTGVLEQTIVAMQDFGVKPSEITAVIGPCIGPDSYEVSKGFETDFLKEDPATWQYFREGKTPDKLMFDLPGYVMHRLKRAGVQNVSWVGTDTVPEEGQYFSHRRTTLAGQTKRGLQMSVISLKHS